MGDMLPYKGSLGDIREIERGPYDIWELKILEMNEYTTYGWR